MNLVYFTPNMIEGDLLKGSTDWRAFHALLGLFGGNAATMDRTRTLYHPFDFHVVDLVPFELRLRPKEDFSYLCLERATELLEMHDRIQIMYSGGLDSTCVLLAFRSALSSMGYADADMRRRLTILTTPEAQRENPVLWDSIIGKLEIRNATVALRNGREPVLRIQGEHADQLFGSDRVMANQWLMEAVCTIENIERFVAGSVTNVHDVARLTYQFAELSARSPRLLLTMRDFLWWVNFTCKWQSVTFRTLAFSDELVGRQMSLDFVRKFHTTFFNTPKFQALAMSGTLNQWGEEVNPRTYKQAARDFIESCMPSLGDYCKTKVKVGSLYNVIRQTSIQTPFIGIDQSTNQIQSHAHPLLKQSGS